jgi:hypothetical protein
MKYEREAIEPHVAPVRRPRYAVTLELRLSGQSCWADDKNNYFHVQTYVSEQVKHALRYCDPDVISMQVDRVDEPETEVERLREEVRRLKLRLATLSTF